ncbi:hypothetical protein NC653_007660 [Populus alba x Populus x berolinensis]|uniref:Uncharacterized protein n=1 Tax=Populus alba x Populus x berolinensis TaxID=444605 RepID=A0AAD6RIW4_9ROSI|nr:hypothetical protein NC653_007660 [Populus alba x Populus x berolinensis]
MLLRQPKSMPINHDVLHRMASLYHE